MKVWLTRFMLALGLFLSSQSAWSACTLSATEMQKSIDHDGAKKALWDLAENDASHWTAFTSCLETGEKPWLQIVLEFAPYRDGFVGEDMDIYLGRALASNAENVLRLAVPTFDYKDFCGMLENDAPDDPAYYLRDLDARDRGLDKVKAPDLKTLASECHQEIQEVREYIKTHPDP